MLRLSVVLAGLLLSLLALSIMLCSVLPSFNSTIWMISIAAAELSFWFGLAGLLGAAVGLWTVRWGHHMLGIATIATGLAAVSLGAIPAVQAMRVAAAEGMRLSLGRVLLGPGALPAVEERRDIVYATVDGTPLRLDLYRPASNTSGAALPALIVIHGGGWDSGTKGGYADQSRAFAARGMVVFDVDYRLAREGRRFPVPLADVKCAIGWVKQNAATYGVDPGRIGLLGRSAGANLALLAAYTPAEADLAPSCPVADTAVQAVVSFYAPIDLIWGYTHPPRPDFYDGPGHLRAFLGGPPDNLEGRYLAASPRFQVSPSAPPTLAFHGARDAIVGVDHARFLRDALAEAGARHQVVILPWANHGFDFFRNGWGSQIAEPLIWRFFETYLGVQPASVNRTSR